MKRAVFLDRDGVLTIPVNGEAPRTIEEFKVYPEANHALQRLNAAGFLLVVVTNQPDVGRNLITHGTLRRMHEHMKREIPAIDHIEVCPHPPEGTCYCRKPKPGMLAIAACALGINIGYSFMVGDRWTDIAAGRAAGCKTIWINQNFIPGQLNGEVPDYTVRSVGQAADVILALEAKNVAPDKRLAGQNLR